MTKPMRWIHHGPDGRVRRGQAAPDDSVGGDLHCYDEDGNSIAIVDGVLYVNGRRAAPGQRRIAFEDGELPIIIKSGGRAERKTKEPRGGDPGGGRS